MAHVHAERGTGSEPNPPGQMTAAMRAVSAPKGPKVLRIGVVRQGRILEERILSIGAIRPFERVGAHYYLKLEDVADARIAFGADIRDMAALRELAGDKHRLRLPDDARGRVVLDGVTLLFQFVLRPPPQPRPQLPLSVQGGILRQIDWDLTILAAFSFLIHFGLVGALCSDWMDPVIDESVVVRLVDPAPNLPQPMTEVPVEPTPIVPNESPAPATGAKPTKSGRGAPVHHDDGVSIAEQARAMQIGILGAFDTGPAVKDALNGRELPPVDLSQAAKSEAGVTGNELHVAGNSVVHPGASRTDLASIGNRHGGERDGAGHAAEPRGPSPDIRIDPPSWSAPVADAERVVSSLRPRFRVCYQRGLNTDPEMAGAVTIVAKVAPNGEVLEADPSGATGLSPDVIACIQRVVRNAQFAAPGGTGSAVRIPVKFVRQTR
ncbi:AgmX/PglI C-terminal domain-containing protein [Pendulispora brunnea]|uniref:AgmX/PglI C-terminal domain-containing protein n=1 Tax=Pendulispora brunnea TaxID=2905690 RepID=A0ABZ2KHR3_9BACT